jgi:hypothetical protein
VLQLDADRGTLIVAEHVSQAASPASDLTTGAAARAQRDRLPLRCAPPGPGSRGWC